MQHYRSTFFVPLGLISALIAASMFAGSSGSALAFIEEGSSSSSFTTSSSSFSDSTSSFSESSFSSEGTTTCGNGNIEDGEQCDDANSSDGDGCSADCTVEQDFVCPSFYVDELLRSSCYTLCGNGEVDGQDGEQCDDENSNNGDGCSSTCKIESGYECHDENSSDGDSDESHRSVCTVPEHSSDNSGDEPQGSGGYRGDRTQQASNEVSFLAHYYTLDQIPPPAYGGGEEPPLSSKELSFICSVQRTFRTFSQDIAQTLAVDIAQYLGRDPVELMLLLLDPNTCDGVDSNQGEMSMNLKAFYVDAQGIPVTGDTVLDACLRGGASLEQIRGNIDAMFYRRADVWVPLSCADYHTGDTWHDTKGNYFGFDGPESSVTPPEGYAVLPLLNVAER